MVARNKVSSLVRISDLEESLELSLPKFVEANKEKYGIVLDEVMAGVKLALIKIFPDGEIHNLEHLGKKKQLYFTVTGVHRSCVPNFYLKSLLNKESPEIFENLNEMLLIKLIKFVRDEIMALLQKEKIDQIIASFIGMMEKKPPMPGWTMWELAMQNVRLPILIEDKFNISNFVLYFENHMLKNLPENWQEAYKNPRYGTEQARPKRLSPSRFPAKFNGLKPNHKLMEEDKIELCEISQKGREAASVLNGDRTQLNEDALKDLEVDVLDGLKAEEALIITHQRFIRSIAKKYARGMPIDDLIQAGNLGLVQSIRRFNKDRGVKFMTFAAWKIRAEITIYVKNHRKNVRVPGHVHDTIKSIRNAEKYLRSKYGREPREEELLEFMDLTKSELEDLNLQDSRNETSLFTPVGEDSDSKIIDFIHDENSPSPDAGGDLFEIDRLHAAIDELNDGEQRVVDCRFLSDEDTLESVGERFGVSRQMISNVEKTAIRKLRFALKGMRVEG